MDFTAMLKPLVEAVGITPACLIAVVCIWVLYRLLMREKDIAKASAESLAKSLNANTAVTLEIKTLIETWLRFIKDK